MSRSHPSRGHQRVAAVLRKRSTFASCSRKNEPGCRDSKVARNLYSAALPGWIAAGLEEGAEKGQALTHTIWSQWATAVATPLSRSRSRRLKVEAAAGRMT